ncbi:MAG TPA: hypothetical protein VMY34_00855 [Acidimicrobiales bacterium]|nr:hypothetical protein [Acidimicrobiales bacterium]
MDDERGREEGWVEHEVDLTGLDLEDWDAVERAVDELRALPESERARRFERWRKETTSGVFLTAVAIGLARALGQEPREEIPIHMEASGPPDDDPFDLSLGDGEDATHAVVVVKPWLLNTDRP